MGFSLQRIVVAPERHTTPSNSFTVWKPEGVFSGYCSWPGPESEMSRGKECADICCLSWTLSKLITARKKATRANYAPPFVMIEDTVDDPKELSISGPFGWILHYGPLLPSGSNVVMPLYDVYCNRPFPSCEDRRRHNAIAALSRRHFRQAADHFLGLRITSSPLYMWERCTVVAGWLEELLRGRTHTAQKELKKDREAHALVEAQWGYLRPLTGRRILFVFEMGVLRTTPMFW